MLAEHPAVERVFHPSLPDHPGHEIAKRQQDGFGAMVSFELAGETEDVADLVSNLTCLSLAESLGGVESLISHPTTMSHASMSAEARAAAGISDQLLRLSIGDRARGRPRQRPSAGARRRPEPAPVGDRGRLVARPARIRRLPFGRYAG